MEIVGPTFILPEDAGLANIGEFQRFQREMEKIVRDGGAGGEWFEICKYEFLRRALSGESLRELYEERRDARVVLSLWLTSEEWRSQVPLSKANLQFLKSMAGSYTGTKIYSLIDIFLLHFEEIPDIPALATVIVATLGQMSESALLQATKKQKANSGLIFSVDGPRKIAAEISKKGIEFADGMNSLGLTASRTDQFSEACRRAYFVEVARGLGPGENHKIFNEMKKVEIKEGRYSDKLNLGQAVCAQLIETCKKLPKGMPDNWLSHVTGIMCDPRLPKTSPKYQKWWPTMSASHEKLVKKWLASLDLQLFLQIFEDCSKSADLRRMYPARRAFLEGLLNHYEIEDACLIISHDAADFIKKTLNADALSPHARMNSREQSAIYLNVNGLHLFEGTHNFAARLGKNLDPNHPCITRSKRYFDIRDVTTGVERHFGRVGCVSVRHFPPLRWQNTLIDAFRLLGVKIKPEHVITPEDYREYRRQYGV